MSIVMTVQLTKQNLVFRKQKSPELVMFARPILIYLLPLN